MREALRQVQVPAIACERVDVGQHFVHAAVFRAEHLLHLGVRQVRQQFRAPVRERDQHVARLRVAADHVGIAEAREQLVQVVPGHPGAIEAEALDLQLAGGDARPQLAALRHGPDVAVAVGALALGQFADHHVEPPLRLGVAGRCPRLRQRGQVVAGRVALQAGALPVGVQLALRLQPRLGPERRQQPIDVERVDVGDVQRLRALERTVEQPHLRERERLDAVHARPRLDMKWCLDAMTGAHHGGEPDDDGDRRGGGAGAGHRASGGTGGAGRGRALGSPVGGGARSVDARGPSRAVRIGVRPSAHT